MSDYIVEAEDIWRVYRVGSQQAVTALRGVNLRLATGQLLALKGRSGSGKTTLLNCIAGLDRPTRGTVRVLGRSLAAFSERQLTLWRRNNLGIIFQSFGLLPTLSAYENVELVLRIAGVTGGKKRQQAQHCLDLVGLGRWSDHRPYEMSGGQQQRLAIARALVNQPPLLLADEPTGELDSTTATDILTLFRQIVVEEGVTILMASHDALVDDYADQILYLHDGQITPAAA